jgi:hypothetical protein
MIESTTHAGPGRLLGLIGSLAALTALALLCLVAPPADAAEGGFVESWEAGVYNEAGEFDPTAGGHPFRAKTDFELLKTGLRPLENVRTVEIETPPGLVINPQAVPTCSRRNLFWEDCPPSTQVGKVELNNVFGSPFEVYNVEPRSGSAAEFAFIATVPPVFVRGEVTADGRIRAVIPDNSYGVSFGGSHFEFYGVPADPANGTGSTIKPKPLITNPTSCVGVVNTTLDINSYQTPSPFEHWVSPTPVGGTGCAQLDFEPFSTVTETSGAAGAPTGLTFEVSIPQNENPEGRATAHVKSVEVALPEGMTVNPSAADGLAGCTPGQMNLQSTDPVTCPDGSKIGSVEVETPLLEKKIGGSVYLAQPYENPSDSLLGLYVVAENEERGVRLKIPGKVAVDQSTGRLTAKFDDNPQLPYETMRVRLNGGDHAALMNPTDCGTYPVTTKIAPWSAADPNNPTPAEIREQTSTLKVDSSCAARGFSPKVEAGTEESIAGKTSPFVLSVTRSDGDQEIGSLSDITLPEGLLGYVSRAGVCPASSADAGNCPADSLVGRVQNAVGAGPSPAWLPQAGKSPSAVYLAGPYRGAPYSLSVVVPAQAGPFDLGRVVARAPLNVDPYTARLSTEVAESRVYDRNGNLAQTISGALPRMIEGIPLRLRAIRVLADRSGFILNPTNCARKAIGGTVDALSGPTSAFSIPFGVSGCRALDFAPRLALRLKGATARIGHPALTAVVTVNPGEANIGRAQVNLPRGEFLDQGNLNRTCTKPVLTAGNCPTSSVYGHAKAWTPLLGEPLEGNVYLVGGYGYKLPALVADLRGDIRILLVGKVDSGKNKGIRNTFEMVPDAPVEKFELSMKGGKKYGLLENSESLCKAKKAKRRAIARFTGQNGKVAAFKPVVQNECGKGKKKQKKHVAHGRVR